MCFAFFRRLPWRALVIIPIGLAAGCTWTSAGLSSKVDYQAAKTRSTPLEVPPDLSQLPKDERFTVPERPQTVTASSAGAEARWICVRAPSSTLLRNGRASPKRAPSTTAKAAPSNALTFSCHDGARRDDVVLRVGDAQPAVSGTIVDASGALRPLPHVHGLEAFYAVRLARRR